MYYVAWVEKTEPKREVYNEQDLSPEPSHLEAARLLLCNTTFGSGVICVHRVTELGDVVKRDGERAVRRFEIIPSTLEILKEMS